MSALVKYEIPQVLDMTALVSARKVMGELVSSLTSQTETSAKVQGDLARKWAEDKVNLSEAEEFVSSAIEDLSSRFDKHPEMAAAMYELLKDKLLPYVKDERDYAVLTTVRSQRLQKRDTAENTDEIKSDFDEIRTFTIALFTTLNSMGLAKPTEEFPVKTNKAGNVVPDLPMLPRGGGSKDGRATKVRKVRWAIDGESLPSDTIPQDVIRKVYSVEDRRTMTVSAFFDKLGEEVYSPNGVTVKVGDYTVHGFTPAGESDETESE